MATARVKEQTQALPVGIYCRISKDTEGLAAGVDRQEADCRSYCARVGYEVAEVYVDNDLSAYSGKRRPAYEQMLADLEAGRIGGVVCYHLDRLHRQPVELEHFFKVADSTGATLGTVTGEIDLGTSDGQFHARIMGAVAKKSSDDTSRRIKRALQERATNGQPHTGGHRPFGYEVDGVTLRQSEAEVVREAAKRTFDGEGLARICRSLNERGVTTAAGKRFTPLTLKRTLLNPRVAGLQVHQGEVIGQGAWEPIITEADQERLTTILTNPVRTPGRASNVRKHVLSGLAVCSLCGHRLSIVVNERDGNSYCCRKPSGGCGKIAIRANNAEERALELLIEEYVKTADATPEPQDNEARKALVTFIAEKEARRKELAELVAEGVLTKADVLKAGKSLAAEIDEARRKLIEGTLKRNMTGIPSDPDEIRARWELEGFEWKRSFAEALAESFIISPHPKGVSRKFFAPERVQMVPAKRS